MKKITRFIRSFATVVAFISLVLGGAHLLRVRSARGMVLRAVKSISEGLSPFLAIAGILSAIAASILHAPWAVLAGTAGALLQARYIRHVTRPHRAFEDLFGEDWQIRLAEKLPADRRKALLAQRWSWRMPRSLAHPRWERDLVYHTIPAKNGSADTPLLCDLWLPPKGVTPSGLSILYVHGGGYFTTAKDFGTRAFFRHLASQGHVAMDINYRLGPQANLFDMLSDVQHAVAWLKHNAARFGADPNRIVLSGGSAGAHLALLTAYTSGDPQLTAPDLLGQDLCVQAVVSYYGVIDMVAAYHRMKLLFTTMMRRPIPEGFFERPFARRALSAAAWIRGVEPIALREYMGQNQAVLSCGLEIAMEQLLGGSPDEVPETYKLVSPLNYVHAQCPTTLFFQGAHDYLLPVSITRKLHAHLLEKGVRSIYIELPQTEHTFDQFLPEYSPPAQVALYDLDRFLAIVASSLN